MLNRTKAAHHAHTIAHTRHLSAQCVFERIASARSINQRLRLFFACFNYQLCLDGLCRVDCATDGCKLQPRLVCMRTILNCRCFSEQLLQRRIGVYSFTSARHCRPSGCLTISVGPTAARRYPLLVHLDRRLMNRASRPERLLLPSSSWLNDRCPLPSFLPHTQHARCVRLLSTNLDAISTAHQLCPPPV